MKVIISGGGTGGHIYPAIAIANTLKKIDPKTEILFVGAEGKMEMEKVPKAGYPIVGLPIVGIQRKLSLANLALPFKLFKSLSKAKSIIKDFQPDVVVGVGGFASGPTLMMANWQGVPTLIQEQNSYAGVTNKLLSKKASKICVAYPNMERFFDLSKIEVTGNPVRSDIANLTNKKEVAINHFKLNATRKTLFVMGGSLGARSINQSIYDGLETFTNAGYQIVWQTGKLFIEQALAKIEQLNLDNSVKAFDFIYEMDLAYAIADAVISRAGALSVSELCIAGKPAILVPYPLASEDHQTSNALSLTTNHAAILVKDSDTSKQLVDEAIRLLGDVSLQNLLSENIKKYAAPNAAEVIAHEIRNLVNKVT